MKLAIFGGTFDPIHFGHLLVGRGGARAIFSWTAFSFCPPAFRRIKKPVASPAQRLSMVRKALRGNPAFECSDWEIRQRRTVYTVETIAHFKALYPNAALFFILGSDALRDVPTWRQGAALLRQCRFLVVDRKRSALGHPRAGAAPARLARAGSFM